MLLLVNVDEEEAAEEVVVDDLPDRSLVQLTLRLNDIILVGLFGEMTPLPPFSSATPTPLSSLLSNLAIISLGLYLHPKLTGAPLDTEGLSPSVSSYSRT